MAECSSQVPSIKEDETKMECEMSALESTKVENSPPEKGDMLSVSAVMSVVTSSSVSDSECAASQEKILVKERALTLLVSEPTSAAASTPVSDSECAMSPGDAHLKKGALTLPVSGATSAAASTPVSDSDCATSPEILHLRDRAFTLSVSGATSAAQSTTVSGSECAMSPGDALVKEGALTLPVSGATSAVASTSVSDSGCAMSPEDTNAKDLDADPKSPPEAIDVTPQISGCITGNQEILSPEKVAEMLSPEKEKVGLFKGVKTAIKTKVKSVWKKLSPKKPEKAALAASVQETESAEASVPQSDKKPIKVVAYVCATKGSLVLNSVASEEMTLDTNLSTSASEVFLPDADSIASCDTATHASRLPSLGESCSEPSEKSSKHDVEESSGNPCDEAKEDGNDVK